ncbi:MAG: type II toxin-antitoxin system RatA family toxin [Pseudomonadota bacterium]
MPSHSETKHLPYTPDQMYDLVADVNAYPKFLPWCAAARIRSRQPGELTEVMDADLVISFKVFREKFGSRVTLWNDRSRIDSQYIDGPFRHMDSSWHFAPHEMGCEVRFDVDFEFKNALLQGAASLFFNDAMQRVVRAFERRAQELHGG